MRKALPLLSLALLGFIPSSSQATSVAPWHWEYQIARAGFVGIVRCEVAGLIAAKYRVVESWKGPPAGSLLTIDRTLDFWGPYTPYVLVGQEFLVCAFPRTPESSLRWCSGPFGCGQPYWWRESGAELYTSLASDPVQFPIKGSRAMDGFGIYRASWKAYRESVLTFAGEPAPSQERRALSRWAKMDLRIATRDSLRTEDQRSMALLLARIDSLDVDALVAALLVLSRDHPDKGRGRAEQILVVMGRERTLAGLRSPLGLEAFPGDTTLYRHPIRRIAGRLQPERVSPRARTPSMIVPSDSALLAHRFNLKEQGKGWFEAFIWLTEHDPGSIVEFFEQETVPLPRSWTNPSAYNLAAYFGWRCNSDRARWFERLLGARDPVARVAGAVYLAYEDTLRGTRALREFTALPGFAGAWAAVVLASMGQREVVPRALELFEMPHSEHESNHEAALKARFLVLLSNSAAASGLKQPPVDPSLLYRPDKKHEKAVKKLRRWWSQVDESIRLSDPWRPMWAAQRID
jgi:hypothetical protein